jgi:hypothetical protein
MRSAFGVDHGSTLSKRDKRKRSENKNVTGSALVGGGSVVSGVGLLGGGIPGVKSDSSTIANMREGSRMQRIGAAMSSGRGGIFGYRTDAHVKALNRFAEDDKWGAQTKPNRNDGFMRGRQAGKSQPEVEVIRHMKNGRKISNAALIGGAGVTAYGAHKLKRSDVKKSDTDTDRFHGALLGGGATAGGVSILADKILTGQSKKWRKLSDLNLAEAQRLVPNLKPEMSSWDAHRDGKKVFAGKSKKVVEEAGRYRGHATQQNYFSNVYAKNAKAARKFRNPALATSAVGGAGLALTRKKDKRG